MDKNITVRGHHRLDYQLLNIMLTNAQIQYETLRFAQDLFTVTLSEGLNNPNYNPTIGHSDINPESMIEGQLYSMASMRTKDLQGYIIGGLLAEARTNHDDDRIVKGINIENQHFLKTKFLSNLFEILEKYIIKYAESSGQNEKTCILRKELRSLDWYIILYFLRNAGSHTDGYQTKVEFLGFTKILKPQVQWKDITITEGMYGHEINYNDKHITDLYLEMRVYINDHKKLFTTKDGVDIAELLPLV
jgi:hypothetical protein